MSIGPEDLTPRQGKVLRFTVMNGVVLSHKSIAYRGRMASDLPRTSLSSLYTLWKLVQLGLVEHRAHGHIGTPEGRRVLKEADSRHLWAS